jgi:hypothetical protein
MNFCGFGLKGSQKRVTEKGQKGQKGHRKGSQGSQKRVTEKG